MLARTLTLVLTLALPILPGSEVASASAQTVSDLLTSVQNGGGWVSVPIREGEGRVATRAVPTMGMSVAGCVHVWEGHSGLWEIEARDALGTGRLDMSAAPGESSPFEYTAGMRSRIEIDFRWSEPRDTTLFLWVGLARNGQDPAETCTPKDG